VQPPLHGALRLRRKERLVVQPRRRVIDDQIGESGHVVSSAINTFVSFAADLTGVRIIFRNREQIGLTAIVGDHLGERVGRRNSSSSGPALVTALSEPPCSYSILLLLLRCNARQRKSLNLLSRVGLPVRRGEPSLERINSDDLCYGLHSTLMELRYDADGTHYK
jgi:hypothetical protein